MNLYDFNLLELNDRMEVINQKGIYLDSLINGEIRFNLYAIDRFFVEVSYNALENKIKEITSFKSGHLLDKYSNIDKYLK